MKYYQKPWCDYAAVEGVQVSKDELREAFERAVHRQLMTDVPYGVLLSGGLDSSLVAAVAARYARHRVEDNDTTEAWWPRLHSFAIGLEGLARPGSRRSRGEGAGHRAPRLHLHLPGRARRDSEVIRHIETYDVTTIRASTPMYLLARRIRRWA